MFWIQKIFKLPALKTLQNYKTQSIQTNFDVII